MKFESIIPKIVKAFGIESGNVVLLNLWGENKDIDLLDSFAIEVGKNGGLPIKWQYSRKFLSSYFKEIDSANLSFDNKYFKIFTCCDVVVDLCTYAPPYPGDDFPKDKMPLYGAYMEKLFNSLSGAKKFIQVRVPSFENAESCGLDFKTYEEELLNAMDIDYEDLKAECKNEIKKLSENDNINIYTEGERKLSLCINGRRWISDDGDGDLPCGEVYIAPVENMTEGSVLIPSVTISEMTYENVEMTFECGRLIKCSSKEVLGFLKSVEGADVLCELGIGMNKSARICKVDYIDEKVHGTCHIGFGANTMFGGKNISRFHADFTFKPVKIE